MSLSQSTSAMRHDENLWLGTSWRKNATSSPRIHQSKTIKRKPPPPITPDLLEQLSECKPPAVGPKPDPSPATLPQSLQSLPASQPMSRTPLVASRAGSMQQDSSLTRKNSITGHLKNALRRRSSTTKEPLAARVMNISTPTDFKHVSGIPHESASRPGSTASSLRSSVASNNSADLVFHLSPLPEHARLFSVDTFTPSSLTPHQEEREPLKPSKSIRRPMKTALPPQASFASSSNYTASFQERRKAMYAASSADMDSSFVAHKPSYQPGASKDRSTSSTLDYHARMHRHYHARTSSSTSSGEQSPELSRSPSSTSSSLDSDSECSSRNAIDLTDFSDYPRLFNLSVKHDMYSTPHYSSPAAAHRQATGSHVASGNFF